MLTETGTLFCRFIGLFTKAKYNHVSLCLDDDMEEFFSFGRKVLWFPFISGFVTERLDSGVFKVFSGTDSLIYALEVENSKYARLKSALEAFKSNRERYRYNFIGMLGVIFNRPLKREDHYFCTQFVATVLSDCGIHDFNKDPSLATPHDFHTIPGLVRIYEGKLSEFSSEKGSHGRNKTTSVCRPLNGGGRGA